MTVLASRDAEGYLIEPVDWNEDIARELAKEENIELDDMGLAGAELYKNTLYRAECYPGCSSHNEFSG